MDAIRHELWIAAHTARVFDALTTKEDLDAWWGPALAAEPVLDSVVELDHGLDIPLRMRIVELVPNERVSWRCITDLEDPGMPGSEWLGHRIAFELEPGGDDPQLRWLRERLGLCAEAGFTILRFTHSGWGSDSRWLAFCNASWGVTLDGLKRHCETGKSS